MVKSAKIGLVHIYCGEGKGKTTAAMGLITRALGHGFHVAIIQFLKDGRSGELATLRHFDNVVLISGEVTGKFTIAMSQAEKAATRDLHLENFQAAVQMARKKKLDLLLLDEVLGAIESGLMEEEQLLQFLDNRPEDLEVVLTGRTASPALLKRADYISRIACVRHPYQRGVLARQGIEF